MLLATHEAATSQVNENDRSMIFSAEGEEEEEGRRLLYACDVYSYSEYITVLVLDSNPHRQLLLLLIASSQLLLAVHCADLKSNHCYSMNSSIHPLQLCCMY